MRIEPQLGKATAARRRFSEADQRTPQATGLDNQALDNQALDRPAGVPRGR